MANIVTVGILIVFAILQSIAANNDESKGKYWRPAYQPTSAHVRGKYAMENENQEDIATENITQRSYSRGSRPPYYQNGRQGWNKRKQWCECVCDHSFPTYPGNRGRSSYPERPGYPNYPRYPSYPEISTYPRFPAPPGYPGNPGYPGSSTKPEIPVVPPNNFPNAPGIGSNTSTILPNPTGNFSQTDPRRTTSTSSPSINDAQEL